MTVTNRSDIIRDVLITQVTENLPNLHVSPCDEQTWAACEPAPYSLYGWRPAMVVTKDDGESVLTVPICPAIIDAQTANLSQSDLHKYLLIIAFLMSHVAVKMGDADNLDPATVQDLVYEVEDELDATNPGAMRFLSEVIATSLDS